jgi:hypothetical protein
MKLRLVNEVESEAIWEIVNEWWKKNGEELGIQFSKEFLSMMFQVRSAISEFCANQEGLTIFKHRAMSKEKEEAEEKKTVEEHMKKWRAAIEPMEKRVNEAVKKNGQKPYVIYSAYQCDEDGIPIDNLDEIAIEGNCVFVETGDTFYGDGSSYESDVFYNPTWLDIAVLANEMIKTTQDMHHVFLEGIIHTDKEQEAGRKIVRFCMGS